VVQIVLEVPVEQADQAYRVLGGMPNSGEETWVAVARLKQESEVVPNNRGHLPEPDKTPPASAPERPARANRLTQQAAIACRDKKFQTWVRECLDPNHEGGLERTEAIVREYCGVETRAHILPGTEAARRWDQLYSRFVEWELVE